MRGRNREDPNDLATIIKDLKNRVRNLEQQVRAQSTAIRSGDFALIDATLTLTNDPTGFGEGTRGTIRFGRHTSEDDEGYALRVRRALGQGGSEAFVVLTVDGSVNGESFTPTVMMVDKVGGETVVGDAIGSVRGMGHPRIQVPWYIFPDQLKSSTSGTFADIGAFTWYASHPHLRVTLIVQNDASTVSEVEVRDSSGNLFAEATYPGSTNAFEELVIPREVLINDSDGINGNATSMTVRHRRVSGAGTVRTMITDVVGIDLSFL